MTVTSASHAQHAGKRILVIGAGVSGLTTAYSLRQRGFDVTVVADRFGARVTSAIAGALWEWPPAVCGRHDDERSLARSKVWCEVSYERFADLAREPSTGVFLRPVNFYFMRRLEDDAVQLKKMEEVQGKVRQFRRDLALIAENQVNATLGIRDAYTYLAPMIDTDVYLHWLMTEIQRIGCQVRQATIAASLREQEPALAREYGADAIVNCAGLGAKELALDELFPVRGALIRVRNDGKAMPRITAAHCISREGSDADPGFVFILPRGEDMLLLGGFAEPNEWDLSISLNAHEPIRAMHRRCVDLLPVLRDAEIDSVEPVRVGLRPFRSHGVRLELEAGTGIVHNYGHGGSGVTLSWGCTQEVVDLIENLCQR